MWDRVVWPIEDVVYRLICWVGGGRIPPRQAMTASKVGEGIFSTTGKSVARARYRCSSQHRRSAVVIKTVRRQQDCHAVRIAVGGGRSVAINPLTKVVLWLLRKCSPTGVWRN